MGTATVRTFARVRSLLPHGRPLPEDIWKRRHRAIVAVLWLHVPALAIFGAARGYGLVHSLIEGGILIIPAAVAGLRKLSRTARASAATVGLMTASGVLVHLSNGTIEAHFHFFVMVTVIVIYQSWVPFLLAVGYVVAHHAIMGSLDPHSVFNHPAALNAPFKWALIHGLFILGASSAGLVIWNGNEMLQAAWERSDRRLFEAELRRRQALELNDNVLQGLVVAEYAFELGDDRRGREAVRGALSATKEMVSGLLEAESENGSVGPGDLVRKTAAGSNPAA